MFEMQSPLDFYEIIALFFVCYTTCSERLLLYATNTEHNLGDNRSETVGLSKKLFVRDTSTFS